MLGAIVIEAMLRLTDFGYLKRLRGVNWLEFAVAMVALFGVLILGVLPGIGFGVGLALILLIYRASYPGTSELGELQGEDHFRDISLHPGARKYSGLLIFRLEHSLIFPNAAYFTDQVHHRIEESVDTVREVLIDCETMTLIDTTGASALIGLSRELHDSGIRLSLARARDSVRERMRRAGVDKALGMDCIHDTIRDGVRSFLERGNQPPARETDRL
jgi:MFS superfamily sulfate permease-like transporter